MRSNSKIHVIKDESLGGIEREYVEVDRKAEVGDKAIQTSDWEYKQGDIGVIDIVESDDSGVVLDGRPLFHSEYKTLEPTDIVHIDGERYRMVDRKAEVGERVIIVEAGSHDFAVGDITEIKRVTDNGVDEQTRLGDAEYGWLYEEGYLVLESVESGTSPQSTDDIIANLVRRVSSLERQVTELERVNKELSEVIDRDRRYTHDRFDVVKDDLETWAQEVEKVKERQRESLRKAEYLNDKIEMVIDDIVTLDARTEHVNPIKARGCCGCR